MSSEFVEHLLEQLAPALPASARRMFGGHGLYAHGVMFGLVAGDTLYLKVDDVNRAEFEDAGAEPFVYEKRGKPVALSYYELPAEAHDDESTLVDWARSALDAALRAARARSARPSARRSARRPKAAR